MRRVYTGGIEHELIAKERVEDYNNIEDFLLKVSANFVQQYHFRQSSSVQHLKTKKNQENKSKTIRKKQTTLTTSIEISKTCHDKVRLISELIKALVPATIPLQ